MIESYKINIWEIFISVLLFLVIYISDDTYVFSTNINYSFISFRNYTYFLYLLVLFPIFIIKGIKSSHLLSKLLLALLLVSLSGLLSSFSMAYFLIFIMMIVAYLFVSTIPLSYFKIIFVNIIYYLTIYSLVTYLLSYIYLPFIKSFPLIENIGHYKCYFLLFTTISDDFSFPRNQSIFREPGVYMMYLNLAIIFTLFSNDLLNKKRKIIIFVIAMLTTLSTGGLVAMLYILSIYFIFFSKTSWKKYLFLLPCFAVFMYVIITNDYLSENVFHKLNPQSDNGSGLSRLASLIVPIYFSLSHFFGVGLDLFVDYFTTYSQKILGISWMTENTFSNTYSYIFGSFGVIAGILYLTALFYFAKRIIHQYSWLIWGGLILIYSNENVSFSLFFNILLFYGMQEGINEEKIGSTDMNKYKRC